MQPEVAVTQPGAPGASLGIAIDLQDGMQFRSVGIDGVAVQLDSDAAHGGSGAGLRPMELLLISLGSCTAMDVISILRKKRQEVTGYLIEVEGARAEEYPKVFTAITIRHRLWGELTESAVRRAIELSESKYCPIFAMLSKAAEISSSFEIQPAEPGD